MGKCAVQNDCYLTTWLIDIISYNLKQDNNFMVAESIDRFWSTCGCRIGTGGINIFPILQPEEHPMKIQWLTIYDHAV